MNGVSTREGRASRTALLGFLTASIGSDLFKDVSDPWLTVPRFVLVVLGVAALAQELTTQAHRQRPDGVNQWARTDTANVAVLVGFAALLSVAVAFQRLPQYEETSAVSFAALFVVLAAYFRWLRGKTLA